MIQDGELKMIDNIHVRIDDSAKGIAEFIAGGGRAHDDWKIVHGKADAISLGNTSDEKIEVWKCEIGDASGTTLNGAKKINVVRC